MGETTSSERVLESEFIEFKPVTSGPVSSAELIQTGATAAAVPVRVSAGAEAAMSPVFKELATPTLPALPKENRARLQMQSPNRLFFYWSLSNNPFQTLNRALGSQTGSYTLVLKLVDLRRESEEIRPAEASGSWWFDVQPDGNYRAEIGFYAPNRPFVRILFSNSVHTPRQSPSPRSADTAEWSVSADRFSRVLNAAGFARDAFDVAMAGDDEATSEHLTRRAFARLAGPGADLERIEASEIRFVMLALASGMTLESLRGRISMLLYRFLQANSERISGQRVLGVLKDEFGIEAGEVVSEESGAAVFGASLVNFPRVLRKRRVDFAGPSPLSSYVL